MKFNVEQAKQKKFHGADCDTFSSNLTKISQYCLKDLSCWLTIETLQTFGCKDRTGVASLHVWHDGLKDAAARFPEMGYNVEVNFYNQQSPGMFIVCPDNQIITYTDQTNVELLNMESELQQPLDDGLKAFNWTINILKKKQMKKIECDEFPKLDMHRELSTLL